MGWPSTENIYISIDKLKDLVRRLEKFESERHVIGVDLTDNFEPSSELSNFLKTFKITENNI